MSPPLAQPGRADPGPASGPTLLAVDDEPSVLAALRRQFRLQGYTMLQASGGAEGLEVLRRQPVDLVISDMRMPGMDGAQFLEAVREFDPAIVRILLTGYADIESTIAAINRGAIHRYIAKPWDSNDLHLVVRDALQRRALETENAALAALTHKQNDLLRDANQTLEGRVQARTAELQQVNAMLEASYADLDRTFTLAVTVFSGLLEMRGGHAGHSRRVAQLARDVGQRLGLSSRELRDLSLGALVHDIGEIGFTDRMLDKPLSAMNTDEMARYRRHPVDGEAALMPLTQLQGATRIVRQHHERFDGKGFPDGIGGHEICIGARIVAAASDYDGLLQGVIGETRQTTERARQSLQMGSGSRYDPAVIDALLKALATADANAAPELEVSALELRPGMVLAHDLLSPRGSILLAAGYVFDARIIRQVCDFDSRDQLRLRLRVRRDGPSTAVGASEPVVPR